MGIYSTIAQIHSPLHPPIFPNDENKTLIARGVHYFTLAAFGLLILTSICALLFSSQPFQGLLFIAAGIGLVSIVNWQVRQGEVRRASFILVSFGWAIVALFVYFSGGLASTSSSLYLIVILMAGLFLGWQAGVMTATLALAYSLLLTLLHSAGYATPSVFVLEGLTNWLVLIFGIILVLVPVVSIETGLRETLHSAKKHLAEREKVEAALRDSEERLRMITSVTSDYTFSRRFDEHGQSNYLMISGAFEAITGYTPEEFQQRGGWEMLLHPDDVKQNALDMEKLGKNERVVTEVRIIRKDGNVRWVRIYAQPVWDAEKQQLIGINGGTQDITERHLSEIALLENQTQTLRFRDYLKAMHGIAIDLSRTETLDDFFRRAVELGRTHLGFDRLGLWLFNRETMTENGTFGTDVQGQTVDERHLQMPVGEFTGYERILSGEQQSLLHSPVISRTPGESLDMEWLVQAALWDGEAVIGYLSADNAVHHKPIAPYEAELLSLYGATLGNLYKRKLSERALRDSEIDTRHFQQQLQSLHEIGIALDSAESVDDLWQMAVELGRSYLGFDRTGIWLYDHEAQTTYGTFGTDLNGHTLDERGLAMPMADFGRNLADSESVGVIAGIASGEQPIVLHENVPIMLPDGRKVLGIGWSMQAVLWDGKRPVGHISADNVINHQPLMPHQMDLLLMYGITVGHIYRRKQAENALRQSEGQMRALLDATTDIAFLMAADGTFLTVNKRVTEVLKRTTQEFAGANAFEVLYSDVQNERRAFFDEVLATKSSVRWVDATATTYWDNSLYPIIAQNGEVEAFAMYSRDISEQKRLEAELQRYTAQLEQMVEERTMELRRAKEQIEVILNNTSDALALAQPDGDIQTANPAYASTFKGASIEHILGLIASEAQVETVGDALLRVINNNESKRVEAQIVARDGADRDIDLALIPVRITGDDLRSGILVSARDITHLKEIERFKTKFVEDAVHDLAAPISGLTMRLYLLKRTPEKLQEHVQALENQVAHMSNLLDDLRTLSRLDRDQVDLDLSACDVGQLVQRLFDTYEPVAMGKQQRMRLNIDENVPVLRLDIRQFERVIANLISNAIYYTPDGREIEVQTVFDGSEVIISVKDQGIGIDAEDLPRVFERFFRTANARKARASGTGLGLAIVKEIVEIHGGTVSVESDVEKGSTFSVRMPVNKP